MQAGVSMLGCVHQEQHFTAFHDKPLEDSYHSIQSFVFQLGKIYGGNPFALIYAWTSTLVIFYVVVIVRRERESLKSSPY